MMAVPWYETEAMYSRYRLGRVKKRTGRRSPFYAVLSYGDLFPRTFARFVFDALLKILISTSSVSLGIQYCFRTTRKKSDMYGKEQKQRKGDER